MKAVCFGEALKPEYKEYAQNVCKNAKALAARLMERGVKIVSGGTDNHSMLVDLRTKYPDLTGKVAEKALVAADITANKNMVPFEPFGPGLSNLTRPIVNKSWCETAAEEDWWDKPCGTGPYKFVDHQVAQSFTLEAFEEHHAGAAQIKTVRYDIIADSAAALLAFEAGSFDFFRDLGNTDVDVQIYLTWKDSSGNAKEKLYLILTHFFTSYIQWI